MFDEPMLEKLRLRYHLWKARASRGRQRLKRLDHRRGRRGRPRFLLPGLPQQEQREGEDEKQDQSLNIHRRSSLENSNARPISGNRVKAAGMPGMAAQQSPERKPAPVPAPVPLQRL